MALAKYDPSSRPKWMLVETNPESNAKHLINGGPLFLIGDRLKTNNFEGEIIAIERSITFATYCYQLISSDKKTYWVYENQEDLIYIGIQQRYGRATCIIPPNPTSILE